ncbi:SDR family oxidoreductase [Thalassobaculum sp. OXR-137]|uniref:SDR family NAD(P)-dependent oxidoreductase n=1 Tax=Thalassobaculum sp. OXR-137 TaxID=3100173 RepID=UPI002AC980A4|nr:SDR family oxidoreductase [Thalassobaculum sp. OXR-137]WPZ34667.1 SDR family oxidoreductase [Thalassobaculum sp. OXR-137]
MTDLSGKVALVTGASAPRGIGQAIARRLAADGAAVVVTDMAGTFCVEDRTYDRMELLTGLAGEIAAAGGTALALPLDVTRADDIARCLDAARERFGTIDILVNNAGSLAGAADFMETTPDHWESSFQINLLGPVRLCQAVIPAMRAAGGGRIINIGSTGSLGAEPGFGAYTAMKHAIAALSKTIAAEEGKHGILCNTVCPGFIMTDMHMAANRRLAAEAGIGVEEMQARRYATVATRSAGQPEDVAAAVAYLAGPQGRYVTGINLPVSGGVPYGI